MLGWQAAGSAPIVHGEPVLHPETIATAIRIGNPASWAGALAARDESGGHIGAITDAEILDSYRFLASEEGCFVEPASAASIAGLLQGATEGLLVPDDVVVCTVTGHGLKDPERVIREVQIGDAVAADVDVVAGALQPLGMTTALVTGATAGIGRAFVDALAARGDDVVLVARDGARLESVAAEIRTAHGVHATPLVADLLEEPGLAAVEARLRDVVEPIDLLVNNAGMGTFGTFADLDVVDEERAIRLNVLALVRLTHAALETMVKRHSGAIVNMSSLAAYQPDPFERDVRRDQGVRPQLHARAPRGGARHRRAPHGGVSGLHAHRVPRTRRSRRDRAARVRVADARRRWSRRRSVTSIGGARVSIPGVLNKTLSALTSVSPAGVSRRIAGMIVRRSG